MQPEKPESQVKLQLFASRLNVCAPVALGNTRRRCCCCCCRCVCCLVLCQSFLPCWNLTLGHCYVGISLACAAAACYLLGSLGRTIARKLLGNWPAAAAGAGTVSRDCSSRFNDAQHMPIEMDMDANKSELVTLL